MRERYYTAAWEWGCCGTPLHVGDDVELEVQYDSDYAGIMRAELASVLSASLTGVETRHDDDMVVRRGRIVALDGVISDTKWVVTPRTTQDPPIHSMGNGAIVSFGNTAPGEAEGTAVEGTSRLVPVAAVPDADAQPAGTEPDLTVYGEQITAALSGYVITLEVP
ncbi:DUF6578 domain-containing protein [Glutamicibacter sp. PS]|uniref:DUF6578 domain-containing protein n=1 Tax=Glutamicibacter sp. PS TaxID=3075634 RepID=UPI0037BF5742